MISEEEVIRIAIQQSNKNAIETVIGKDFIVRFAIALFAVANGKVEEQVTLKNYWRDTASQQEIFLTKKIDHLEEQLENVQHALDNSISWHDDSGRYIPAFDTLEEAALIYEFDVVINKDVASD